MSLVSLNVNGRSRQVSVDARCTLADVIRNTLGITGTKIGCNREECGACTVLLDGKPVYSCGLLAVQAEGKKVLTVEGLSQGSELHPLQQAFIRFDAFQCGYCTPGFLMSLKALLDSNPNPSREDIKDAISGNLCRCGSYMHMIDAVFWAAEKIRHGKEAQD